jgi:hypothetical protein
MDNFDLWTKQNIIDIIFNFNEKNYELLRNFIKWYEIESNYMYILSTRYFYSNECLKLLLSTINTFIDVKNTDILEKIYIDDDDVKEIEEENNIIEDIDVNVNELEKEIEDIDVNVNELEKEIEDIDVNVNVNELEKEIEDIDVNVNELKKEIEDDIIKDVDVDELKKKNDSDEYVINDDYYFTKDIVKKEDSDIDETCIDKDIVDESGIIIDEDDEDDEDVEDVEKDNVDIEDDDVEDNEDVVDEEEDDIEDDVEDVDEDVVDEDVYVEDVDVVDEEDEEDEDNLIINEFSNNEIILLLNILKEDTKKFSKHNYIIGKCKKKIFFYETFYLGFTTGMLVYCLLKLL